MAAWAAATLWDTPHRWEGNRQIYAVQVVGMNYKPFFIKQIHKSNYILGSLYDIVASIKIIIGVRLFYFKDRDLP